MSARIETSATPIEGLILIQPRVFKDERGCFMESYNRKTWQEAGLSMEFVQDNQSLSMKHTLRGLHFQLPPYAQGKMVRVITGSALDIAVDLRKDSPTYGKHFSVVLSGDNFTQMYIPEGFAHGFLTLEDKTVFSYKCTNFYNPATEGGLLWNDPELKIDWGISSPFLAQKDLNYPSFKDFNSPF